VIDKTPKSLNIIPSLSDTYLMKKHLVLSTALLIAPTLASAQTDNAGLRFKGTEGKPGNGKHVVLIAGDEEYRSEESCPMLGKILAKHHGFDVTVLFSVDPEDGYVDPNNQKNIPGTEAVNTADLVITGLRFRDLPDAQLQPLADYLNAGKPIFGFRTSTHAFKTKNTLGGIDWANFGPQIIGEGWAGHYGKHRVQGARGVAHAPNAQHPILNGVENVFAESDVYGVKRVTDENATIIMNGVVTDTLSATSANTPGKKPQPAVWLREYTTPQGGKGTCLGTTFGSSCDLDNEGLRRIFINGVFHLTGLGVPARADVSFIDPFVASRYTVIRAKGYYKKLNKKPADYGYGKSPNTTKPMSTTVEDQATKASIDAKPVSGPKVNTTVTKLSNQQIDETRPTFKASADLSAGPKPTTTLPLRPTKSETIVFLGNGLAERMQHFGHFESLLHQSFPEKEITFRNMGFPGHTPGFRPEAGQKNPWAFPDAHKFRKEIRKHRGRGHYPTSDEWLTILEADTIVAFFGFNESFDGADGVANFKAELAAFVDHTLTRGYNGKTAPHLVLVTPIAMEQHKSYHLPDAALRNTVLAQYAETVKSVAQEKKVGSIDLFTPTSEWFKNSSSAPLTINGIHFGDSGYRALAPLLFEKLFDKTASASKETLLRDAILDKSWFWRNDYRMLNGVHAYGSRWAPYGNINYPEEIEKIRQMTVLRDRNIWKIAQGKSNSLAVDDTNTRSLSPIETNYRASKKNGTLKFLTEQEALKKFTLPEGYKVSVFATEKEFPNLGNPVQMRFDNRGRLWVSTVPSYPHYKPGGERPDDKLLIYEDTDGDGRADKETVFADQLHVPIGFELTPEGVYISEEPYLTLHKDTDGDSRADTKNYILDGFDPHDTHHAISAFDIDHGGGIFMCEGRFLHSQIETPWGIERMTDGGVWRFDPASWKVERVLQRDVHNPWGVTHDAFGQNFLNDASDGNQYWMLGYSVKVPHAHEIAHVTKFNYEHHTRPTSGSEFIHTRHFPDEVQGDYIYANTIGFLGIKQYKVLEDGSEIKGEFRQDLIQSSDGNFRPCDVEFAPDGSLYFIDWHNTLIGHMQHSARDPKRNSDYGRIYRITYPSRPLVETPAIAGASLDTLFENMKLPEINTRKRSHRELRGRDATEVVAKAHAFASANPADEKLGMEALWATWGQQQPSPELITRTLSATDHRVRAAAVRVVRHSLHLLGNPAQYFRTAATDTHPRVRMEALTGGSWLGGKEGAEILLTVASQPTDRWIRNALNSAVLLLKQDIETIFTEGTIKRDSIPDIDKLIASKLSGAAVKKNYFSKAAEKTWGGTDRQTFQAIYNAGRNIFEADGSCKTCHQETGVGIENVYPPIVGSPWVTGNKDRLIKLTLHGLMGPIEVLGKKYAGQVPMTAVGAMFDDAQIASVLTYVRNSWGNSAPLITPDEVKRVRAATKERKLFYSPEDLLKEHPFPSSKS